MKNGKQNGEVELDTDDMEDAVAAELGSIDEAAAAILEEDAEDLVDEEDEDIPESKKDVVLLYKPKCLTCTHLFPEGGKKPYNGCHYKAGNEDCPARTLKLVVAVPAERVSDLLLEATLGNDVVRLSEILGRLNRKDQSETERVMKRFREKLAAVETGA